MVATVLFVIFFALCLIGVPIAMSLFLSAMVAGLMLGLTPIMMVQNMFDGVDSFVLLAIPLFMLVGELMNQGSITDRLIDFSGSLVGHIRGGLGHVTVVANMILSGISGSGVADAAATGSVLIPAMTKKGYPANMAVAINASAATLGPIIPPSIIMVVYGAYGGVSISGLFLGGIIPGILIGLAIMIVIYMWARKGHLPQPEPRATMKEVWLSFLRSFGALLVPIIIIGGIVGGYFTATESAMVACVYCAIVASVGYRSLNWHGVKEAFKISLTTAASPLFAVAGAGAFGYILAYLQVPKLVVDLAGPIAGSQIGVMFFIIILYLILGTFMDAIPAIIIFLPIVQELSNGVGLDPLLVGVVVTCVLCFGFLTPPYGLTLLLSAGIGNVPVMSVLKVLVPIYVAMLVCIFLMVFFPDLVMVIPDMFSTKP